MSKLKDKIDYLKSIYEEENARQPVLEGKCAQNISNSGIFLTLIGLLIGILSNAQSNINLWAKVLLVLIVIVITVLNVLCIIFALRALDPLRYPYARGNPDTVNQFDTQASFDQEVINDYIYCIGTNMALNNKKAGLLIQSRRAYVCGIYLTGFFTILLIAYVTFLIPEPLEKVQKIEIASPVNVLVKPEAVKHTNTDTTKRIDVKSVVQPKPVKTPSVER